MTKSVVRCAWMVCVALLVAIQSGCGGGGNNNSGTNPGSPRADFSLTFSPASLSMDAGSSLAIQVSVLWTGTTTAPITLTAAGLPQGVSFIPAGGLTIPAGSTSATFGLTALTTAAVGSATMTATATAQTSTTLKHQYKFNLAVAASPGPLPTPARTSYILTGEAPESIVYDKGHKLLYASVPALNQVLVIDPATHKTLKKLTVPAAGQSDISPDGSEIVVGSDLVAELVFISTATQSITSVVPFTVAENGVNDFGPRMSGSVLSPVFLSGGDVLFISGWLDSSETHVGALYRWSATAGNITKSNAQPSSLGAGATSLSRTPDGSKVLVTTTDYETDIYDAATDSITAHNTAHSSLAAADPANPRFAVSDSNGFEILDTDLNQLASLPFSTTTASMPYGLKFSLDGTKLFVAESGLFSGLYAYQTVDTVNYTMGSLAPLMSFDGNDEVSNDVDSEYPLAIDETNLIYGEGNRGIAIDDPLNYYNTTTPAKTRGFDFFDPNHGPVGVQTLIDSFNSYPTNTGVYFFTRTGSAISAGATGASDSSQSIATPPVSTPGPASIEMVEPDNSFSFYPAAFTFGVQAVGVEPAAGPSGGGITANVTAYGVGGGTSAVTVTVGGAAAKVTAVQLVGGLILDPLPLYDVTFTVPPGVAGTKADVTVTASGYSSTLTGAFEYEQQLSNYPYPDGGVPNSLVYDPHRQRVYLLTSSQVDVFSLSSHSFLAPIVPPTLNGKTSLTGMDISIDGSLLAIANLADQSVALVNPDSPSNAKLIPLAVSVSGDPGGPYSVAATSKGTFFVGTAIPQLSGSPGSLYELDPSTGSVQQRLNVADDMEIAGFRLLRSADGTRVLVASPGGTDGPISLWNSKTDTFASLTTPGFVDDGAISGDGTTISFVDSVPGGGTYVFALDSSYNMINNFVQSEGLADGLLFGQFLNPSGALLYIPGSGGIDVYDVHKGTLRKRIGVLESDIPNIYQAATMDETGATLFLLTQTGLDVIEDNPPLSVRSASPAPDAVGAGTVITVRGSGFQPGATVSIGGANVPAIVTDSETLSFSLPSAVTSVDFTVTNPDNTSYTY